MSRKRIGKKNKIKRTSSYRGYNRFGGYRSYSSRDYGSNGRSLGKAVMMAVAVVAAASLVIFLCATFVPKLVDISKRTFVESSSPESSDAVSSAESPNASKAESSKPAKESSKTEPSKAEASAEESSKTESNSEKESGYEDNGVFIYNKTGYALFDGTEDAAERYAQSINSVAQTLDTSINVYSMVVPTHSSIAIESLKKDNAAAENENIERIRSTLSENITFIDVREALKDKKDEYIYFNTDESWTSLGAYYGYRRYCEAAGLTAADMGGAEKKRIENFAGGLVSLTKSDKNESGNPDLLENLDTVEYYPFSDYECGLWRTATGGESSVPFINSEVSAENALDIFCYGDVSLLKIYTGKSTGKRLCIVKDSYGSVLAPYFTENYDEIHVIDARYFDSSLTGYCYNHSITDVLFVNGVNNANTNEYAEAVSALSA